MTHFEVICTEFEKSEFTAKTFARFSPVLSADSQKNHRFVFQFQFLSHV